MGNNIQKDEGVGEWDDLTVDTVNLKKMIATTIEILSHKDAAEQVWNDVCKALTSATREAVNASVKAAEERKEKWIMFQKSGQCSSLHRAHPETEWEKGWNAAVDAMLRSYLPQPKLSDLPPPPSN